MKHFRTFEICFLGATNSKGSRVKIKDTRHKKNVIVSYNHSTDTKGTALQYLNQRGIEIIGFSELDNKYLFLTDNFETQIK